MVETRRYEAGLVRPLDGVIHAIRNGISGETALCGAGRIETRLVGRFDESSGSSCLKCMRALSEAPSLD